MRAALASILAAGGLLATSCVDNDHSVFIEGALPVLPGECKVSAADVDFLSSGTFDLLAAGGYTAVLKVRTNLPSTFSGQELAQSKTRAPNYPNYGPADNNVVIFDAAEIEYTFETDELTAQRLVATAAKQEFSGELKCSGPSCTLGTRQVAAAGSVFNTQTSLNAPAAIPAQALPPDLGVELARLYRQAALDAGSDATNLTLLTAPGDRQRVIANVALIGKTTGSGDLRPIKTFAFPYPIDLCLGCLIPDDGFCDDLNAVTGGEAEDRPCIDGVDFAARSCFCKDALGAPTDVRVDRDENVCNAAP